ncbi:MAG: NAD-dependent epimerase/dehydratase family protein [Rhodospirillales bacterium]|nr:NAD-dependent epimerase/dehydratase family protein [Rhodospirillales bacterium]
MTRVLVTGATGFIGRALCPALVQAGLPVVVATRNPSITSHLTGVDVRAITGLGPRVDWRAVLRDVGAVVHLAARTPVLDEAEDAETVAAYRRINVDGSRKLAEDAARAGVRRFVFVSTAKVHGDHSPPGAAMSEQSPVNPASAYARSKADAESALAEVAAAHAMELVVVRPPLVYGPGVGGNMLALLKLAARARVLPFGAIRNARSLIYVGNLADAIRCALQAQDAAGRVYLVRDGEDLSTPALLRLVGEAMGRRPLMPFIPTAALKLAATMTGRGAAFAKLAGSFQIDDARIRRELGWTPPVPVLQGMHETAAWYTTKAGRS